MKKIALFCVICLLLAAVPSAASGAEISVQIKNASQDLITVSGAAPTDTQVLIQIYNPGKSKDNLDTTGQGGDIGAMQYFGSVLSAGGTFTKDIKLNTDEGGNFKILVSAAGVQSEIIFPYYPYELKETYVEQIASASDSDALEEDIPEILKVFGFEVHELYTSTTAAAVAKTICAVNADAEITNPDNALIFLNEVLVLNAFNEKNQLLLKDGEIDYSEIWAENGDLFADYAASLSDSGKKGVNSAMMQGGYKDIKALNERFYDEALYHLMMSNAMSGSGHMEGLVTKYEDLFEDAGFKTSLLGSVTNTKTRFTRLLGSGAGDIFELAESFNSIFKTVVQSGGSSSGGSGPSSVSSVPSSGGAASFVSGGTTPGVPSVTPTPAALPFGDVSEGEWCYAAIKALFDKGIVSGRDEKTFAPNENVTRAEFVKIICEAFKTPEASSKISFADVSEGDWFASYVYRAAAAEIVKGDGTNFNPAGLITREDAAVIISRVLSLAAEGELPFGDAADISDYAKAAVSALYEKGLISGMGDGSFAPKANLTRAQAAQMIYNAMGGGAA